MKTRRQFVVSAAAALVAFAAGTAHAAPPTVEIVAMPHPPVQSALKPLRDWLGRQGGQLHVVEIDADSPAGEKRLASVGLHGHVPILILIDGRYEFSRKGGGQVALVNFPAVKESPPGIRGNWLTADVEALLADRMK